MDKQSTYNFLREEMMSITNRQDTLLSIAYAAAIALWTIALTINNEWIVVILMILLLPFSLKTYDLRYANTFLAAYLKVCLEECACDGWETIRDIYYQQGFYRPLKFANNLSKFSYLLLTLGSCFIFWLLRIGVLKEELLNFQNIILITLHVIVVVLQSIMVYQISTTDKLKGTLEKNWMTVKKEHIDLKGKTNE